MVSDESESRPPEPAGAERPRVPYDLGEIADLQTIKRLGGEVAEEAAFYDSALNPLDPERSMREWCASYDGETDAGECAPCPIARLRAGEVFGRPIYTSCPKATACWMIPLTVGSFTIGWMAKPLARGEYSGEWSNGHATRDDGTDRLEIELAALRRAAIVRDAKAAFVLASDEDTILTALFDSLQKLAGDPLLAMVWEAEAEQFRRKKGAGPNLEFEEETFPIDSGYVGKVFRDGLVWYDPDVKLSGSHFCPSRAATQPRTVLTVPLDWENGGRRGVLQVQYQRPRALKPADREAIAHLADLAGSTRAELKEAVAHAFVRDILLSNNQNPHQVLSARRKMSEHLAKELYRYAGKRCTGSNVRVYNRHTNCLGFAACEGRWTETEKLEVYRRADKGTVGRTALESGSDFYHPDVRKLPGFRLIPSLDTRSVLARRFLVRDRPAGVVAVDWDIECGLSKVPGFRDRFNRMVELYERVLAIVSGWEDQLFDQIKQDLEQPGKENQVAKLLDKVFDSQGCSLYLSLKGGTGKYFLQTTTAAAESAGRPQFYVEMGSCIEGEVAESMAPQRGNNGAPWVAAPMIARDKVLGILRLHRLHGNPNFSFEDETFLCEVAERLASAIDSRQLDEDARSKLAILVHDPKAMGVTPLVEALALQYQNELRADGAVLRCADIKDRVEFVGAEGVLKIVLADRGGNLADSGETRYSRDIWIDKKFADRAEQLERVFGTDAREKVSAAATIKLRFDSADIVGYFALVWNDSTRSDWARLRLEDVARRIAEKVEPSLLLGRERRENGLRVKQLEQIRGYTEDFAKTHQLKPLGASILDTALRVSGMESGAVYAIDRDTSDWIRIASSGRHEYPTRIDLGRPKTGALPTLSDEQFRRQQSEDIEMTEPGGAIRSLRHPLCFEGNTIGFVELSNRAPRALSGEARTLLDMVCGSAALTLDAALEIKSKEELAAPFALIGSMMSGFLHVMRNCLNNMHTPLNLLQNPRLPLENRPGLMKIMEREMARALDVIQNIALLSKPRGATQRVDLSLLVERAMAELRTDYSATLGGTMIAPETTEPKTFVDVNPAAIELAIRLLVQNSIEALAGKEGSVCARVVRSAERALLMVGDNGPGMDPETKKQCLNPFFTTKGTGNGLGLAVVVGIVRRHGGTWTIRSVPGRGTAFTITLPLSEGK